MMKLYSYEEFIYKNWELASDTLLRCNPYTIRENIESFQERLTALGIRSNDMVDWRIYSLLCFNKVIIKRLSCRPNWIPQNPNMDRADECFNVWDAISIKDDVPQTFHNVRVCLKDEKLDLFTKIGLLLRCKYLIHHNEDLSSYIPVYLSLYVKIIKDPFILNKIVVRSRAWGIISSIHYFPKTLAIVEYNNFPTEYDWFLCNFLTITCLLEEDD